MLGLPHKSIFADKVQVGERTIAGNQLKWSAFHDFPASQMYSVMQEWVFPFIKNLHADKDSASNSVIIFLQYHLMCHNNKKVGGVNNVK